ncbi:hypothetical protein F5141DRAFT_1222963 [Pisolithus sp. B1]|nr:hypothetical protein F5141DRAFT_1222963 [Pisolithus sp. B1]
MKSLIGLLDPDDGSMLSQPCVVASLCNDIRLRLQGMKKCAVLHPNSAFVIAWLIASSKAVVELFASHGRTPPTFRTPEIARTLDGIIGQHWHAFPSQTDAWENVLRKSEEDGCICSLADCRGMRQWFDMMVWLEDDIPPNLEVGNKPCVRCRSLLKSRYDDITAKYTVTSSVSLLDAFTTTSLEVIEQWGSCGASIKPGRQVAGGQHA